MKYKTKFRKIGPCNFNDVLSIESSELWKHVGYILVVFHCYTVVSTDWHPSALIPAPLFSIKVYTSSSRTCIKSAAVVIHWCAVASCDQFDHGSRQIKCYPL